MPDTAFGVIRIKHVRSQFFDSPEYGIGTADLHAPDVLEMFPEMVIDILGTVPSIEVYEHLVGENIAVGKSEGLHRHPQLSIIQIRKTGILKRLKNEIKTAEGCDLFC